MGTVVDVAATVNDVLRGAFLGHMVVVGGSAGLGREVRRIVRVRPTGESSVAYGGGDLVLFSAADWGTGDDRPLISVLSSHVAGVVVDLDPDGAVEAAERHAAPLVRAPRDFDVDRIQLVLEQCLAAVRAFVAGQEAEIGRTFGDLAQSGGTPTMLLERLVELTVKTGVLHTPDWGVGAVRHPGCEPLDEDVLKRALAASAPAAQQWVQETADATLATVLYLELPAEGVVRLVAPVWQRRQVQAYVSLLARPAELGARDRSAILAMARALAGATGDAAVDWPPGSTAYGGLALRAPRAAAEDVLQAVNVWLLPLDGQVVDSSDEVRIWLPYPHRDETRWLRLVHACHAQLSSALGSVSVGHAAPRGAGRGNGRRALVEAAEALRIGERLFGPGHVTSYSDAQLARFLLGRPDAQDLRALYEQTVGKLAAEDQRKEGELLTTLEVYCDSGCSVRRTAERLDVHRNTVQYRLKRIEDITATSLDDGPTRLLLQVGLVAGRLVRQTSAATPQPV